jgi:hypothetical protein
LGRTSTSAGRGGNNLLTIKPLTTNPYTTHTNRLMLLGFFFGSANQQHTSNSPHFFLLNIGQFLFPIFLNWRVPVGKNILLGKNFP